MTSLNSPLKFSIFFGSQTYNPGLLNSQSEKNKLLFLEREVRPLIPCHPLFKSSPYQMYKDWLEAHPGTPPPLLLLAMKVHGEFNQSIITTELDEQAYEECLDFGTFILNATLQTKTIKIQNDSSLSFKGLFPINIPASKKNSHFGLLENTSPPTKLEASFCMRLSNKPYFIGHTIERERFSNVNRLLRGEKIYIPDFGSSFNGHVTQEVLRADGTTQNRETGTWGDKGNGSWGLTGDGVIEAFGDDGTTIQRYIGYIE